MKILLLLLVIIHVNISAQNRWIKSNGPGGGFITAIFAKGDTLLAGTGVYKGLIFFSKDGGGSWEKAKFKICSFQNDGRVDAYLNSQDGSYIAAAGFDGIYKSYDLINWSSVFYNSDVIVSLGKDYKNQLYAGSSYGNLYHSSSDGLNWSKILNGLGNVKSIISTKDSILFVGATGKVLKKFSFSDPWLITNLYFNEYVYLFNDNSNNIYIYNNGRFFCSSDSGATWNKKDTEGFLYGNYVNSMIFNNRIIAAFDDASGFFGTGWGIAVSDDQGLSWKWSNNGLLPKFSGAFRLAKSGNNTYLGTISAGVFKSTDYGDSWFPINNGLNAANVLNINFDNQGNLWAACWSNGIYKSTDKGLSWSVKNNGLTNVYLYSVVSDTSGILIASTSGGTFRSTDNGENWVQIDNRFFALLYRDSINRIYGLGYGFGVYRTSDAGLTWQKIDKGFQSGYVLGFTIDKENNLYAGTNYGIIYKSTDDGLTWSEVYNSNNQNCLIMDMAVAPNGYIYATNMVEGVLRSTDNGVTWTRKKSDNFYVDRYPIEINKDGNIFISGGNNKFYSSTNNGDTWVDITDNLALTSVQDIKFDKDGNMFLATDESVWRSNPDFPVDVKEEKKSVLSYSLSQNYPNPFNPYTEIKYSIPAAGFVSIKVYNILGKEVTSLVNEEKGAGEYSVIFNGSRYPSGVYFYTIRSGNFTETKKLILLK